MMRADRPQAASLRPTVDVSAWRFERLRRAGIEPHLARRLADEAGFDVHAVIELLERGCPPALAARILAPLHERRER